MVEPLDDMLRRLAFQIATWSPGTIAVWVRLQAVVIVPCTASRITLSPTFKVFSTPTLSYL